MKKEYPKISIIVPTLNQSGYIVKTIDSILDQDYPNLELIVIDGGSKDGTQKILKSYGNKINYISEKDKGQSDAINKGLKISKGEILTYLNSDDLLLPGSLYKVAEFFSRNVNIYWMTGKCRVIDESGNESRSIITLYKNFWLLFGRNIQVLYILNYISQPGTFFRRKAFDKIGLFDESLYYAMDYDYWLRLIVRYKLGYLNRFLSEFRIQKKSKSVLNYKGLFNEGYDVSSRYCRGPLLFMHKVHDFIILKTYSFLK